MSANISPAPKSRRGEAGFTLIEALAAIVMLAFGLMAITNLLLVAASSNSVANQASAAVDIAAQQMETLKALPFSNAGLCPFPGGPCTTTASVPVSGVGQVAVTTVVTNIDSRVKFIQVQAEGTGVLSRGRSRAQFTTFRSCTTPPLGCP